MSLEQRAELIYELQKDLYDTQPVDIMTFVNDPYYLGNTYGGKLYEIWEKTLKQIYPIPYFSPYYEIVLSAAIGAGKCLGKGTKILMFDGTVKNVEDIKVGDKLMGDDSTPRNVLSTCVGKEPLYRIIPNKGGEPFVCNESHILSLKCSSDNVEEHSLYVKNKVDNIPVKDYLKKSDKYKSYYKLYRTAVDFEENYLHGVDPYLYGLLIGDDSSLETVLITSDKKWESIDEDCIRDLMEETIQSGHKRLLHRYMVANKENRLKLLAGLIDSGGYIKETDSECIIITKHGDLAEDYAFVARSLGFAASVHKRNSFYEVSILGDLSKIPTKVFKYVCKENCYSDDFLIADFSVESLGEGDYYGFEIDGNKLFCLGDFTVTHNTSVSTIGMLYDIHKLLCLKNPQEYYNLTPNTTIAFALFSATLSLASDVNWTSLQEAMRLSPYFTAKVTDKKALDVKGKTTLIPLAKNIGIQIGSKFQHTIGKAVFGALLDEASFQNNTAAGNQAQDTYSALISRSESRFSDPEGINLLPGHLWLASSPSKSTDFLDSRIKASEGNSAILVKKDVALWHAKKNLWTDKVFYVFVGDSESKPEIVENIEGYPPEKRQFIHPVPEIFRPSFEDALILNIMDKLGISTTSPDSLFTSSAPIKNVMVYENPFKVDIIDNLSFLGSDQIIDYVDKDYFRNIRYPEYNRFIMLDAGVKEDMFGISSVFCKPYKDSVSDSETVFEFDSRLYFLDFAIGIKAKKGEKNNFTKIENFLQYLLKVMKYPIVKICGDSYQTENTLQKFELLGIETENISVVKSLQPYTSLRDKVLEGKFYLVRHPVLLRELSELKLVSTGKSGKLMYDHPATGSKDISDTVAGALHACINSKNIVNKLRVAREYLQTSTQENVYAGYQSMSDEEFLELLESQNGSTLG